MVGHLLQTCANEGEGLMCLLHLCQHSSETLQIL